MLSEESLQRISHTFCGDVEGFYSYKTGSQLVRFFNQSFSFSDVYGQGFPSRWMYVYNKLAELINTSRFDKYLSLILSRSYIMRDCDCREIDAAEKFLEIKAELDNIVRSDMLYIIKDGSGYKLIKQDTDLIRIGSGGFAIVYKQKSTGLIIKKLREEYLADKGIRSRFKREFNITKSLKDIPGIINVYDFNEGDYSYTMEEAEQTFEKYITVNTFDEKQKIKCIRMILHIMKFVHNKDIIHRDISPNNIFILQGQIKFADFGLGKDLNMFASHQTLNTNSVGQLRYCAPEQFMLLKDGDKKSDVYSLGRLINFVMTSDPNNSNHFLRTVVEKATNENPSYRYADASQFINGVEKSIKYHDEKENEGRFYDKISKNLYDDEIEMHIYEMNGEQICINIISGRVGFFNSLLNFMKTDDKHASFIIQSIDSSYGSVCGTFESYDPIASFAHSIILGDFSYVTKELAAQILRYVAYDVNRYNAQRLIEDIQKHGVEPLLEEILET